MVREDGEVAAAASAALSRRCCWRWRSRSRKLAVEIGEAVLFVTTVDGKESGIKPEVAIDCCIRSSRCTASAGFRRRRSVNRISPSAVVEVVELALAVSLLVVVVVAAVSLPVVVAAVVVAPSVSLVSLPVVDEGGRPRRWTHTQSRKSGAASCSGLKPADLRKGLSSRLRKSLLLMGAPLAHMSCSVGASPSVPSSRTSSACVWKVEWNQVSSNGRAISSGVWSGWSVCRCLMKRL